VILTESWLNHFSSVFLVILVVAFATKPLLAEPLQRKIRYFVDAAGPEYDLELEACLYNRTCGSQERRTAVLRIAALRPKRWRVFLRNVLNRNIFPKEICGDF
jgi:hypothetical protein